MEEGTDDGPHRDHRRSSGRSPLVAVGLGLLATVFGTLWILGWSRAPVERVGKVLREVPVEKIGEVPVEKIVEKIVEVPAELTDSQKSAMVLDACFRAKYIVESSEVLRGLALPHVSVKSSDDIDITDANGTAKTQLETILRRRDIEPASSELGSLDGIYLTTEGFWDDKKITLTWTMSLSVVRTVYLWIDGVLHARYVEVWETASFGSYGRGVYKDALDRQMRDQIMKFENDFLKATREGR